MRRPSGLASLRFIASDQGSANARDQAWYWKMGRPLRNTTYELAFDPETPGRICAAFADLHDIPYDNVIDDASEPGLWLSKDGGKSWKALEGLPFRYAQRVSFDPKDDSVIYVCAFGGSVWRRPAD
jgi:hypothetical protein